MRPFWTYSALRWRHAWSRTKTFLRERWWIEWLVAPSVGYCVPIARDLLANRDPAYVDLTNFLLAGVAAVLILLVNGAWNWAMAPSQIHGEQLGSIAALTPIEAVVFDLPSSDLWQRLVPRFFESDLLANQAVAQKAFEGRLQVQARGPTGVVAILDSRVFEEMYLKLKSGLVHNPRAYMRSPFSGERRPLYEDVRFSSRQVDAIWPSSKEAS